MITSVVMWKQFRAGRRAEAGTRLRMHRLRDHVPGLLFARAAVAVAALVWMPPPLLAVSCTTQSQMTEAQRNSLVSSAKSLAALVQAGNTAELKAETIPSVAERFDPIAAAAESAAPLIERGTITVESLYLLDSTDLKATEDETQFFCGGANSHEVVLTIPQLPPGSYALTILHATGIESPQSLTFIHCAGVSHGYAMEARGGLYPSAHLCWT